MQPITVAIADADSDRRIRYEQSLQDEGGISLLADVLSSNDTMFTTRRARSRKYMSATENEVARARRLKPRVLLVDLNLCSDVNFDLLTSLQRECPEILVVLLVDDDNSISEESILHAMMAGARGYLNRKAAHRNLSRVAQVVERGEIWASRVMLGKIMNRVLNHGV